MLERILGFSLARTAVATAVLAGLAGCNGAETSPYGHVDIIPSGLRAAACDAPGSGQLQLDGLLVAETVAVSAQALCHNWIVRKELPSGLYTVSWQSGDEGTNTDEPRYEIRDAGIVNVFPDRTTTLRVLLVEPEVELPSQALLDTTGS